MTDAGTKPAVRTDHDVGTPLPDDTLAPCTSCVHVAGGHDATSLRWCAATAAGPTQRRCICPAGAVISPFSGEAAGASAGRP